MKTILVLLLFSWASFTAQARSYDDVMATGYLSIAVYRDFPPYSYRDGGVPMGIDIEVGKKIAERLGVRPQWHWLTADENLEDDLRNAVWKGHYLGGGVADVMLRVPYAQDFARMTDEFGELKNDLVVLLGPYHQERWTIARNTKRLKTLPNLAPLMYHKVGVEVDSVPDFTLTGSFGGRMVNSVVHYMSVLDAVDALQTGKIAAVAGMRGPIEWRLSNSKNVEKTSVSIAVEDDSIVQWPRRAWDIGVAIKHTYRQLGYALEGEIEALVKSGEIKTIFEQHGMTYELPQYHQSNQL